MSQNFISNVSIQYEYFDIQLGHPVWEGKKVLDFGGNVGNILLDSNCRIEEENYWCLDVSQSAIEEGQKRYPDAHFNFYNAYNYSFNPGGVVNLEIPEMGVRFDYILAYSIFSHIDVDEMVDKVEQLKKLLVAGGTLIFTFLVADYNASQYFSGFKSITNFEKRLHRFNGNGFSSDLLDSAQGSDRIVLINDKDVYIDGEGYEHEHRDEGDTFFTYYTPKYIQSLFNCEILNPPSEPYYVGYPAELQHACIIRKS